MNMRIGGTGGISDASEIPSGDGGRIDAQKMVKEQTAELGVLQSKSPKGGSAVTQFTSLEQQSVSIGSPHLTADMSVLEKAALLRTFIS